MTAEPKSLRERFAHTLTRDEAIAELTAFASDNPGPGKMAAAEALLDLATGRSMQSTMARFRRAVGIDPPKRPRADDY